MLSVRDLIVYYGKVKALKNINLHVDSGELVAIVGANGAGKSTLLRTISGLIEPKAGSINFEGKEIGRHPAHKITRLGISHVPEGRQLFPEMTVLENIELGGLVIKDSNLFRKNIDFVYEMFPILKERAGQKASTLSGGEQQMLAIARGLMSSPRLFLLDEPSLGLAPLIIDKVADIVTELNKQGLTIILVEQNANMALQLADRAYVLETGEIAMEGKGSDLLKNEVVLKSYLGG